MRKGNNLLNKNPDAGGPGHTVLTKFANPMTSSPNDLRVSELHVLSSRLRLQRCMSLTWAVMWR